LQKIKILPEGLANRIAAGEVVERPASVVKELVENSIDAKSHMISVSLVEGGKTLIRILDDGEGMGREDVLIAFERHATSKLNDESDWMTIRTLGFRGEALASIAAVSKITLTTHTGEGPEGTRISLEGGHLLHVETVGTPLGTEMEVSDLFYNTPARKKFLKSTPTELGYVSEVVFQLALSHPEIHFRLFHQERERFNYPAVSSLHDRALQCFGETSSDQWMRTSRAFPLSQSPLHLITAFFSKPPLTKNNRKEQYIFVNRRPIKSASLSHAVYDAYSSFLMKGEHPFFILFIEIDPAWVDVNVHPTKREVRFQNADPICQAIKNTLRDVLYGVESAEGDPAQTSFSTPETLLYTSIPHSPREPWVGWPAAEEREKYQYKNHPQQETLLSTKSNTTAPNSLFSNRHGPIIRPLGQVYGTFLIAEVDGALTLIDQHAADERILYERLLKIGCQYEEAGRMPDTQLLLIPQQIDLPLHKVEALKKHLGDLEKFGLKIELFGETTFVVREVPVLLSRADLAALLLDMTDEWDIGREYPKNPDQVMTQIIASMACHGAIRAHQFLTHLEIERLLTDYFREKTPPTCPHGRPILMRYERSDLEKMFCRK